MSFFSSFDAVQRQILQEAARHVILDTGGMVLKAKAPGDALFLVDRGTVEIVDTSRTPEVVLDVVGDGELLGEMAFVDGGPRSADARTLEPTRLLRWDLDTLQDLMEAHPEVGRRLYEKVARTAIERTRRITATALAGGIADAPRGRSANSDPAIAAARHLCESARMALAEIESRMRASLRSETTEQQLVAVLDALQADIADLFDNFEAVSSTLAAEAILARELQPWLARSALVDHCIQRPQGVTASAEILAHLLVDNESGDGRFGEVVDRWMLDRPSFRNVRARQRPLVEAVAAHVGHLNARRVALTTAGTGSLAAAILHELGDKPTTLTVVDPSREALAFIDLGIITRAAHVELRTRQVPLAEVALGRHEMPFGRQDALVIQNLVEYLPARLAITLLGHLRTRITDDGVLILGTCSASPDGALLDHLLMWPTIRRTRAELATLLTTAHLDIVEVRAGTGEGEGAVLVARRSRTGEPN